MKTLEKMYLILTDRFAAQHLDIKDESERHSTHTGARQKGGGHYQMTIVSLQFEGKDLLERHKMIYAALASELKGEIHALGVKAYTPQEWEKMQ